MNIVSCLIINKPQLQHSVNGKIRLYGPTPAKEYSFLDLIGLEKGDYGLANTTAGIVTVLVISIRGKAQPEDVVSEYFKPILCKISNQKVQEYYRLRHTYKQERVKRQGGFDLTAYEQARRTICPHLEKVPDTHILEERRQMEDRRKEEQIKDELTQLMAKFYEILFNSVEGK